MQIDTIDPVKTAMIVVDINWLRVFEGG